MRVAVRATLAAARCFGSRIWRASLGAQDARQQARISRRITAKPTSAMVAEQVQRGHRAATIIIDPRVRGQVTVLSNAPMTPDAFYRAFLATLEVHGFVALDSGNAIQIVPDANARRSARGDDYVTQAIVLDNIGAAQLVPILRPLLPQSAHLAAHPTSNASDHRRPAAEHAPHARPHSAHGSRRHPGRRGHPARERRGRRRRADARPAESERRRRPAARRRSKSSPTTRTNSVLLAGPGRRACRCAR